MLSSLTIATHETPTARYFHRDEARTLQVDGELEREVKDLYQAQSAHGDHYAPLLNAKDLRALCEPSTFQSVKTAADSFEEVQLDLGTGRRPYSVSSDEKGNLRLVDGTQTMFGTVSQVIYVGSSGNRVLLSTLVEDGEDTLGQSIKMNLTRSGQFYASQESLAMNSDSLRLEHGAYPLFGKVDFSPTRSGLL